MIFFNIFCQPSDLPTTLRPPSVVSSTRFSGIRHTQNGLTSQAIANISLVAAISKFILVVNYPAIS